MRGSNRCKGVKHTVSKLDDQACILHYDRRYAEMLAAALLDLDQKRLACFAACCAERLMPWVNHFQTEAGLPTDRTVRDSLDQVWNWITSPRGLEQAFDTTYSNLEQLAPDTEKHTERSTSYCLNAVAAVAGAVAVCHGAGYDVAAESAHMVTDTIFLWTGRFGCADPETPAQLIRLSPQSNQLSLLGSNVVDRLVGLRAMAAHPRILRELSRQGADITALTTQGGLEADFVRCLRERSAAANVIPFPDDPIWHAMKEIEEQYNREQVPKRS